MNGTVRRYDDNKKFGFVRPDGSGGAGDVFFHVSELKKANIVSSPVPGDRWSFDIEMGDRGPRAVNIKRA